MTLASDLQASPLYLAIMFDFVFDSGELNIWTRAYQTTYESKTYLPLAGITAGLSLRRSLTNNSVATEATITGASAELKSIALTETFQLRPATVYLAALDASGAITSREIWHQGKIEDMPIVSSPDGPSIDVVIVSAFADLKKSAELRLTTADQKKVSATDTFFDFLVGARES
jgi:hypothetical protein